LVIRRAEITGRFIDACDMYILELMGQRVLSLAVEITAKVSSCFRNVLKPVYFHSWLNGGRTTMAVLVNIKLS